MFHRVVLLLFVVALCYAYATEIPKCPEHEHYNECGGRGCEPVCNQEVPVSCPPVCERGCYCDAGYVRHNGVCIPPEQC